MAVGASELRNWRRIYIAARHRSGGSLLAIHSGCPLLAPCCTRSSCRSERQCRDRRGRSWPHVVPRVCAGGSRGDRPRQTHTQPQAVVAEPTDGGGEPRQTTCADVPGEGGGGSERMGCARAQRTAGGGSCHEAWRGRVGAPRGVRRILFYMSARPAQSLGQPGAQLDCERAAFSTLASVRAASCDGPRVCCDPFLARRCAHGCASPPSWWGAPSTLR